MFEVISVKWCDLYVNALLKNGIIYLIYFSKKQLNNFGSSKLYQKLKGDLTRYLKGEKIDFSKYKTVYPNSKFSKSVLKMVRKIPYGSTVTYGYLAKILKTSPRAVGVALKLNKTPIVIPCHRVVSKANIGGYSFGIEIKKRLLCLENKNIDFAHYPNKNYKVKLWS